VDSAVGKGTHFRIKLPAYDRMSTPTRAEVREELMEPPPRASKARGS
jgi:hypothetical protein